MAPQGNFLVSGKCFRIREIEFFVFEIIEKSHSTFCNQRWRRRNYILPSLLIFPFSFLNLKIYQHCQITLRNVYFLFGKHVSLGGLGPKTIQRSKLWEQIGGIEAFKWGVYRFFFIQPFHICMIHVDCILIFQWHLDFIATNFVLYYDYYGYFHFVHFWRCAIFEIPRLPEIWKDSKIDSIIYMNDMLKNQSSPHLLDYG